MRLFFRFINQQNKYVAPELGHEPETDDRKSNVPVRALAERNLSGSSNSNTKWFGALTYHYTLQAIERCSANDGFHEFQ